MRRPVVALALALGMIVALGAGAAAVARADEAPTVSAPAATKGSGSGTAPGATDDDVPPPVDPSLLVERHMPGPEILHEKPSGFWTSNRPAVGGAYRYRLLLLGVAVAALMATLMVFVIRKGARRPAEGRR